MIEVGDLVAYKSNRHDMEAQGIGLVVAERDPTLYDITTGAQCFIVEWIFAPFDFSETNVCVGDYLEKLND